MDNAARMKDGLISGVFFLFLLFLTLFIPVMSILFLFVLPIPFVVYTARYGWKSSSVLFLFMLMISTIFGAIPIVVLTGITGIMIGSAIHQQLLPYETWARGTLGFVIGILFIFLYVQLIRNINIASELSTWIDQSIETSQDMLSTFGMEPSEENLNAISEQMKQLTLLLPVVIVVTSIFCSFLIQYFSYKVLNKVGQQKYRFPPFRYFQLPKILIWIYFLAILMTWFNLDPTSGLYVAAINITNLLGVIISLQGFSFILYYTYKKGLSKAIPVISSIIIILLPPLGLFMIRILGIIDLGFSLRERITVDKK